MGIDSIEKMRTEEIRMRAGLANITERKRVRDGWDTLRGEKDRGGCCNENTEDGS